MASSNRRNVLPLYYQIEQEILREIHSGRLNPGDQIPTETQLSQRFNVSRITARRAVENLTQQGVVYSRQGKGSFVAQSRIRDISGFRSFSEDIRAQGFEPGSKVVELIQMTGEEDVLNRLKLPTGETVFRLQRVRLADNEPVAYEIAYMPASIFPGLDRYDFNENSLYDVFRTEYKVFPTWADAELEATGAPAEVAIHLNIPVGEPVLMALRLTYTESFEVVEFARSVYYGHRFTFFTGRQYIG